MVQRRGDLPLIEPRVQRYENSADLEARIGESCEVGAVAERDGDAVTFAHAERDERVGEGVGERVEGVVCESRLLGCR